MYLVRAGEIFLKGKNHRIFENKLINNIKKATDCKTFKNFKNLYLIDSNKNLDKVFGITSYSEVIETELDKINETALTFVKDQKSFRIRAKRTTKDYKPSPQIEREVGAHVVEKKNLKVNLTKPKLTIYVQIIKNKAYIYDKRIPCLGGLPVGSEYEVLIQVNDEKLSTVAGYLILKRGCTISLTKELPKLKQFYDYKIKQDHDVIATDETLETLKLETNNTLILRPLIGLTKDKIGEIYSNL